MNDSSVLRAPSLMFLFDEPDATWEDTRKLNIFKQHADKMRVPYEVGVETAIFTDAPPKSTEVVLLQSKDFKQVVKAVNFDD